MKKIILVLVTCFIYVGAFADVDLSLRVPVSEVTHGVPFTVDVLVTYGSEDKLGNIYMDGLDNFTLVGETRSDSQGFTASGATNIVTIALELIGKQAGEYSLGPVLLKANGIDVQTGIETISIAAAEPEVALKQYTPIASIYFKNREFKVSALKNITILFTIFSVLLVLIMFRIYSQNVEMRKRTYKQVLAGLDKNIKTKNTEKFYIDIYNLFKSYVDNEKNRGFTSASVAQVKKKLNSKEYDILDLVYNIKHNISKDSPKYRKKILKTLHKYFDKNIV